MMFGLPRLPVIDYFSRQETKELLQSGPMDKSLQLESDTATVAMQWLTNALQRYASKVPDRETKLVFTKITDIYPTVTTQSRNMVRNADGGTHLQAQPTDHDQPQKASSLHDGTANQSRKSYDQQVQDQMQAEAEEMQAGIDMGFDMDMAMITDSIRNTNADEYRWKKIKTIKSLRKEEIASLARFLLSKTICQTHPLYNTGR